jgi:hypothetical protein
MSSGKRVSDERSLLRKLGVSSLSEVERNERAQKKLARLLPDIDPELTVSLINTIPSIAKGVGRACEATASVSRNLSEVQRERWRTLGRLANDQRFTADNIMELAGLITETEREEGRRWTDVLKIALGGIAILAGVVIAILLGMGRKGDEA